MTSISVLNDADLHGLVDGHLEASRRSEVLRRIASAPADRARFEAWQEQTDLLRAAFVGVDREAIPPTLDLSPKTRLHCVSDAPMSQRSHETPEAGRRSTVLAWIVCFGGIAALSLGCFWYVGASGTRDLPVAELRGSVDEALRSRVTSALAEKPAMAQALPTTTIPDLASAGFTLVAAESKTTEPATLLFRYRNAAAERVVISVARTTAAPAQPPARVGDAVLWHSRANAFAIAGTIQPERLQAIASSLQADDAE